MSTIQLRFEETDITRLYIPGLMQEYPTGLKITPYSLDEKKDLPSFKLSMKKGTAMKLFDEEGKTIWVCTQSVQPWMIDWTKLSGNAMSISLIEDMIRSFLTIYMLRQYPGDYITAIELYGFATQYADYIYYSNRDDVIEEA